MTALEKLIEHARRAKAKYGTVQGQAYIEFELGKLLLDCLVDGLPMHTVTFELLKIEDRPPQKAQP